MIDPQKIGQFKETWFDRFFLVTLNQSVVKTFLFAAAITLVFSEIFWIINLLLPSWPAYRVLVSGVLFILVTSAMMTLFIRATLKIMRDSLLKYVSGPDALRTMTAGGLENLTMALYESQGYKVTRRGVLGKADGGIDLELVKNGRVGLVQCKKWTHENVGVGKIRELYGVMRAKDAGFGIFVTTNDFTEDAEREAQGKIELINHARLWEMVQEARLEDVVASEQLRPGNKAPSGGAAPQVAMKNKQPLMCPMCGNRLVLREKNSLFLGCKSFSQTGCGFTIPIEDGRREKARV